MENTKMSIYTVVLFDGEQAYTERLIAELSSSGSKKVKEYCNTSGMQILYCEPTPYPMDTHEMDVALQNACLRDRYIQMYAM